MSIMQSPSSNQPLSPYAESLMVHFRRVDVLRNQAVEYPSIDLNITQLCDLELLLTRAFFPLEGYLCRKDYESVLNNMRLADGSLWPVPVCLDVSDETASRLDSGQSLALRDGEGFMLAVLRVEEVWKPDKQLEARAVYGTEDPNKHPGVRRLLQETGQWYVGGRIEGLHLPHHWDFPELRLSPSETHRVFSRRGWRNVMGYQTERFPHCVHREMILAAAREAGASIFIMPVVAHPGLNDADHYTLVRCCREFALKFPKNMVELGLLPLSTRWAGPREALWNAIIHRNYGCTHLMVSDNQCDPGSGNENKSFYPLGAGQDLVAEHEKEIGIRMAPQRRMVYVEDKAQYIFESDVTPDMSVKRITSRELRRRLELGLDIPEWFSFPEVVKELNKAYPPRHRQGFTILITGLSGAGKSTLAKVLYTRFMEMRDRPVTLLDGDIVRRNLSSELNFSREHRNLNVTRIGFVAGEITKNRGIAICAPIAPYEESRRTCRELISGYGGYIEVYMATPLEICEQRDRKGIYAKAKAGLIKGVTGIDDPYIPPENPEIIIDTTMLTPNEAAQEVMLYLEEQGYLK